MQRMEGTHGTSDHATNERSAIRGTAVRVTGDSMGKERGNGMDWSPREQE